MRLDRDTDVVGNTRARLAHIVVRVQRAHIYVYELKLSNVSEIEITHFYFQVRALITNYCDGTK